MADPGAEHRDGAPAARGGIDCDPEELAITRNASEALQIAQLGIELKKGDEVITTNQDYGRMLDTWEQRVRRDGITLTKISFPVPPASLDELADRLMGRLTPATRVLHFCHITNLTGQIFPVKKICDEARRRGIKTIVDGAHAFAHFPYKAGDLRSTTTGPASQVAARADRHRLSLRPPGAHPAALAPDAGFGVETRRHPEVRGNRHPPCRESQRDRRSHELPRRHRHRAQGGASAVSARPLGEPLEAAPENPPAHEPRPGTLVRHRDMRITGVPTPRAVARLWERWRIIATPIVHAEYEGARITPNVYTTLEEIDDFATAMEQIAEKGTD